MATVVAVFLLIEKLEAILNYNEMNSPRLRKNIKTAEEKLKQVQTLLEKSNQTFNVDHLNAKLLPHLYKADDIIDCFIIKTSLQRRNFFAKFRPLPMFTTSKTLNHGITELMAKIDEACADSGDKEANPLEKKDEDDQPRIPSEQSVSQTTSDDKPAQQAEPNISEAKLNVPDQPTVDAPKQTLSAEPSISEASLNVPDQPIVDASKQTLSAETNISEARLNVPDQPIVDAPKQALSAEPVKPDQQSQDAPKSNVPTEQPAVEPTNVSEHPVDANHPSLPAGKPASEPSKSETRAGIPDEQPLDAPKPSILNEQPADAPSKTETWPISTGQQHLDPLQPSPRVDPSTSETVVPTTPVEDRNTPRAQTMPEEKQVRPQRSAVLSDDEMDLVGRKPETEALVEAMNIRHKLQFLIFVAGAAGSGKTMFVRSLYNRADMVQQFPLRAWINASEEFSEEAGLTEDVDQKTKNLLIDILKQVTTIKEEDRLPRQQVEDKVRDFFIKKRFLIVLDDVKTSGVWENLKGAFPNSLNGSRVIFITRDEAIIEKMWDNSGVPTIKLPNLNADESWTLFLKKTHKTEESLKNIGPSLKDQIWLKCQGLPLAIVVLGGLLSYKDPSTWSTEVDRVQFGDDPSKVLLALAYQDLPSALKPCLLYLGLFPKEYAIPARRLYRLWAAEGFARSNSERKTPEDLVESYLEELIRRNMIDVAQWRLDGTPKICRVPGILYDNVFPSALEIGFFHVLKMPKHEEKSMVRRVAAYVDISDSSNDNLRSYVSFNTRKGDTPADEIDKFIHKIIGNKGFGLLTVLDLEGVYKPALSDAIGKLLLLSYLGLRWTFLDSIPNAVGDLTNLETLDVKHTNISFLPSSIWNSKKLRHLYMNEIYLDVSLHKPLTSGSLANLWSLWGLLIGKKSPHKDWLNRLKGLRKLGLTCHCESIASITSWIAGSTNLKSLKLRSVDEFSRPAELTLKTMNNHSLLSELYLLGKLSEGIEILQLPQNLKMLTLSVSKLETDPMPVLGKLPILKILRLFARSYLGKDMVCKAREFPELRVLKLWMLEELENWTVEEGSMPCLRELEIRRCQKLKLNKETSGWQQLSTLKEVTLTSMPKDYVAEIQRSMGNKVKVNDWSFSPLPDK